MADGPFPFTKQNTYTIRLFETFSSIFCAGDALDLDRRRVPDNIEMACFTTVEVWVCGFQAFMARIKVMAANDDTLLLCLARYQAFDETSMVMRQEAKDGIGTHWEKAWFLCSRVGDHEDL